MVVALDLLEIELLGRSIQIPGTCRVEQGFLEVYFVLIRLVVLQGCVRANVPRFVLHTGWYTISIGGLVRIDRATWVHVDLRGISGVISSSIILHTV